MTQTLKIDLVKPREGGLERIVLLKFLNNEQKLDCNRDGAIDRSQVL